MVVHYNCSDEVFCICVVQHGSTGHVWILGIRTVTSVTEEMIPNLKMFKVNLDITNTM